jgi:cell division protein FtsN
MDNRATESASELVLDNRKLVIGFLLLLIICGTFFVIGFMEGRRQGLQARVESTPPEPASESIAETADLQASTTPVPEAQAKPAVDDAIQEQLDWYKNVSQERRPEAKLAEPKKSEKQPSAPPETPTNQAVPKKKPVNTAAAVYRVQVGAFQQQRQAQALADALKAKGYSCDIESPRSAEDLYRVKVGAFSSRAEAVAMQLRLKKDGYNSFIKTN